jgi:aryl-alcohol dehydrogenase-like predicted oxidoreductase
MAQSPAVQYKQLGSSGIRVSVPILGAMGIGSSQWLPWVLDEEKGIELLKSAYDLGVTTIDTANMYSNGESERVIGKFIKKHNIPRENLVVITKCRSLVAKEVNSMAFLNPAAFDERDYVNQAGLSRAAIFNAVEASLARLDTPYIDILIIHRFDPKTPVEETMRALHDLVASGKVRYLGASSMHTWQFALLNQVAEKNGWTKFVVMEDEHSLLYREEEREMFGYCKYNGIGLIPYAPLAAGALARPFGSESLRSKVTKGTPFEPKYTAADKAIIERVEELAKKKGWNMNQVALAWSESKVSAPIVGVTELDRLVDSILGKAFVLTEEDIKYLEEPYEAKAIRGYY